MKDEIYKSSAAVIMSFAACMSLVSCDALWGTASVDVDPGYYSSGMYSDWYPPYQPYPGPIYPPVYRPVPAWTRPSGSYRPSAGRPSNGNNGISFGPATSETPGNRPAYNPSPTVVPDHNININGSNPGPAILPGATTGRH